MARNEFTKATQRASYERSGGQCEAVGIMYGLPIDTRCTASVKERRQFDHIILDANSKDNSLENCACVCIPCHRYKTAYHDTPMAAKTLRQQDKHRGIRAPKNGRGFQKPPLGTSYNWSTRRYERVH